MTQGQKVRIRQKSHRETDMSLKRNHRYRQTGKFVPKGSRSRPPNLRVLFEILSKNQGF